MLRVRNISGFIQYSNSLKIEASHHHDPNSSWFPSFPPLFNEKGVMKLILKSERERERVREWRCQQKVHVSREGGRRTFFRRIFFIHIQENNEFEKIGIFQFQWCRKSGKNRIEQNIERKKEQKTSKIPSSFKKKKRFDFAGLSTLNFLSFFYSSVLFFSLFSSILSLSLLPSLFLHVNVSLMNFWKKSRMDRFWNKVGLETEREREAKAAFHHSSHYSSRDKARIEWNAQTEKTRIEWNA